MVRDIVLVSFAIAATGGGRSDLFILYALTTLFFVASYPPIVQRLLLGFTVASYTVVLAVTSWQITTSALVARLSILGVLAYISSYLSEELLEHVDAETAARREADERAALMTQVVGAGRDMTLDPSHVVEVVLDAAVALGFEAAGFVALREDGSISHAVGSRGRFDEDGSGAGGPSSAIASFVVAQGETVIADSLLGEGIAGRSSPGTTIGSPVWVSGWMAAVLVAGAAQPRSSARHRVEAFELLATNAGLALDNAGRYEEQRRTVERLEEMERLKSDFLTSVSHELRTPLTSIIGNAVTLEHGWADLSEGTRDELLASLTARARELEEKITDLVDLSAVESATRVTIEPLDLSMLLTSTAEQMRTTLAGHRLVEDVRAGLATLGDMSLLARVVRNLLDNVATHTPAGTTVTLFADRVGASDIRVEVRDDGPGIAPADLLYVGARFFRGGNLNDRPKGLGLGLALASSALELHGSSLEVESEPGHGARFAFQLSALRVQAAGLIDSTEGAR